MCLEGILLLEGDLVVAVHLLNGLYFSIGGTHHNLTANATDFLYQQFKNGHHLAHRQFVDGKVCQFLLIYPQLPSLTAEAVHEPRAAQQLAHHQRQQFGIALAVDMAAS